MEYDFNFEEFYMMCEDITRQIINIYEELLQFELSGDHDLQIYKSIVLKLKQKIQEERNLYISAYNLIGDNWDDLEKAGKEILFGKYNEKPESLWFFQKDALKKNLDFRLERRIFSNIYLNIYKYLEEYFEEDDDQILEDIEELDFDDQPDVIDLSLFDVIEEDYLLIFRYLLKEYLEKNGSKLSLETYKGLVEIKYDLAFTEFKYEAEFIKNNFEYPDKIMLSAQLKAEIEAYKRAKNLNKDNKSKSFLKYLNSYEKMIYEDSIRVIENSLQNLEKSIHCSETIKIIKFLYLKAVLYSGYCKKELVIQKLNSYKGRNDELDRYLNELLDYKTLDNKICTFSLCKNKKIPNN